MHGHTNPIERIDDKDNPRSHSHIYPSERIVSEIVQMEGTVSLIPTDELKTNKRCADDEDDDTSNEDNDDGRLLSQGIQEIIMDKHI